MNISKTLRGAVRVIKRCGWARFLNENSYGEVCAHGAINAAACGDPKTSNIESDHAIDFLEREFLECRHLFYFNDAPGVSRYDVIALFEIGADIAECNERAAIQTEGAA